MIFAVHPVHTEAVTAIANRSEVLATIFLAWALFVHARPGRVGMARTVALNALCFLALLSKESAITLPLALAATSWLVRKDSPLLGAARVAPAVLLYLALRHHALGSLVYDSPLGYFTEESVATRVLTVATLLPRYALLLIFPHRLSADYSAHAIPTVPGLPRRVSAGWGWGGGAAAAGVVARRRAPVVALARALALIALLPYLHFTTLGSVMAERFLYLPSVGFAIAVGAGGAHAASRLPRPFLAWAGALIIASWFAIRTADRNRDWRDARTLWEATVETTPDSAFAHANLALALLADGEDRRAADELRRAIDLVPEHWLFRLELARLHHSSGRHREELDTLVEGYRGPDTAPQLIDPALAALEEMRSGPVDECR